MAPSKSHVLRELRSGTGVDADSESMLLPESGSTPRCAAIDHSTLSCAALLSDQNSRQYCKSCANRILRSQCFLQRHGEPLLVSTDFIRCFDVPERTAAPSCATCPVAEALRSMLVDKSADKGALASH